MARSYEAQAIAALVERLPEKGQALAAASLPVVLTAIQVAAITPPAAISGFATSAKQLADGHGVVATILPANVTTLTPPTAAAIASAIVSNPPTVPLATATITSLTPPTASAIGTAVAAPTASAIATAIAAGVGVPQANLATLVDGVEVSVAIPAGAKFIDFLVSLSAYVAANATSGVTTFAPNPGVPYQPNLNFRLPCGGATYLHLKGSTAAIHTLQWNVIT